VTIWRATWRALGARRVVKPFRGVGRSSRKPLSVVRRIEGSNPSPSASRAETDAGNRVRGIQGLDPRSAPRSTGTSRDPLTRPRTGARPARAVGATARCRLRRRVEPALRGSRPEAEGRVGAAPAGQHRPDREGHPLTAPGAGKGHVPPRQPPGVAGGQLEDPDPGRPAGGLGRARTPPRSGRSARPPA
jgi:hypothetical protein